MDLAGFFVPTAGEVGLLEQVTHYTLFATMLAFLAASVFFLTTQNRVVPEHRASMVLHAIICLVAGVSYFFIQDHYRHYLQVIATVGDPAERLNLTREAYVAIGQTRYMDWTVTTPLLLLANVLILRVRTRYVLAPVTVMLLADVLMIFTGYLGENQITDGGTILAGPRLVWGTVSTVFYLIAVYILFTRFRAYQRAAQREEERAFKTMALATVTTWGVYPVGYLLALITDFDLNWVHVAFSVADVVNKIGIGLVAFWAAATVYEQRHPSQDNPLVREQHPDVG
ncbi:bacteriorhodopsin [Deinococcus pimensis]|uniref:bacteriorhodopsin n=1 Tax=Deinococcus pimensis TaxID=309888 RepID=UPI000485B493|nr:bacteriorhodopsin [Deinococcus pimensis]